MRIIQSIFNLLRFNSRNWKAVVLCIIAATVFWFFNALNKSYTTNINIPLVFDYDKENFVPVRPLPEVVRFNVTGVGWNLFRRSAGVKVLPLVVPLEQPGETKKIVGSTLPGLITNQPEGVNINFVLTDTLHLALEPKAARWISLAVDSHSMIFKRGYGLSSDIEIVPDSVFIEGPKKLITAISEPVRLKLSERNLDEDFSEEIEVKFLNDELITRNPPTVSVRFEVDDYIEVKDSINLEVVNPPKNVWPFVEGKKLVCTIAIPESYSSSFSGDSLTAVVDLKRVTKGEKKVLPVIMGLPRFARIVQLDSVSIKF